MSGPAPDPGLAPLRKGDQVNALLRTSPPSVGQSRPGTDLLEAHQAPLAHDARMLTAGEATALITLDGQTYTLRITRSGKLILTK